MTLTVNKKERHYYYGSQQTHTRSVIAFDPHAVVAAVTLPLSIILVSYAVRRSNRAALSLYYLSLLAYCISSTQKAQQGQSITLSEL